MLLEFGWLKRLQNMNKYYVLLVGKADYYDYETSDSLFHFIQKIKLNSGLFINEDLFIPFSAILKISRTHKNGD